MSHVKYYNQKFEPIKGKLDLSYFGAGLKEKIKNLGDLENLDKMAEIKSLKLSDNSISRISNLDSLTGLKTLWLNNNQITDISGLDSLENLEILYLSNNRIKKIEGLENLLKLKSLHLELNAIKHIEGLENLKILQKLYLSGNKIQRIQGLETLKNLKTLELNHNNISKIENLDSCINLDTLKIIGNKITAISGLDKLSKLEVLQLFNNPVSQEKVDKYLKEKEIKKKKSVSKSLVYKEVYRNLRSEEDIPHISIEEIGKLLIPRQILPKDYLKYDLANFPVKFRNVLAKTRKDIIFYYKHLVPIFEEPGERDGVTWTNIIGYEDTGEVVKVDIISFFTNIKEGNNEHRIYQIGHRYTGNDDNF